MIVSEIRTKVADIVAAQFSIDKAEVGDATSPEDIEDWDSLSHVALTNSLESAFQIRFDIEEIMEMENVLAIVQLIDRKLN